jgi:hypothetical protein
MKKNSSWPAEGTVFLRSFCRLTGAFAAVAIALLTFAAPIQAGDVLFVSDSKTDSDNIPEVLSGGSAEEDHPTVPGARFRPAATAADHDVTIIRDDYVVTGGTFGQAEGTNPTLDRQNADIGALEGYCSVVWSASGPHEPDGFSGGLGADGGLHTDPNVFTSLGAYVQAGGFVFVTGHDAAADPIDALLNEFLGGIGTTAGQSTTPSLGSITGTNVLTVGEAAIGGMVPGSAVPSGVNPLDGIRDLDHLAGYDAVTTVVVTESGTPTLGAASWTLRDAAGLPNDLTTGKVASVSNGVFLFVDPLAVLPDDGVIVDGEDPSWLGDPAYTFALRNFVTNSCAVLPIDPTRTPVADDQDVTTDEDVSVDIVLTGTDPNGDSIDFTLESNPTNGVLAGAPPNLTYTPNSDFNGPDSFTFIVDDGPRQSSPATVSITVHPVNDPPVADAGLGETLQCTSPQGAMTTLNGTGSVDPEGDSPLTFSWTGPFGTAFGESPTVVLPVGDHTVELTVTDPFDAAGTDSVQIEVRDTQQPDLRTSESVELEATQPGGAEYDLGITASDLCGDVTVVVTPDLAVYPVGDTIVDITATDEVGNNRSNTITVTVRDTTPPSLTAPADVTAGAAGALTPVDLGDPVATDAVGVTSLTHDSPAGGFPLGTTTVTWRAEDAAGNFATDTQLVNVVDGSPPVITPNVAGTLGDDGWYRSDVSVSWTVEDPESGVDSTTGCDPASATTDTAGTTLTCTATSVGGTASESVTVKRDTTNPSVSISSPADGSTFIQNEVVISGYSCSDGLSGIAQCDGPAASGAGIDTSAPGNVNFTVVGADAAGNSASQTHVYTVISVAGSIATIEDIIENFNLQRGLDNSLGSKLNNIRNALASANAGQRNAAVNKLQAFINEVEAQRGKKMTDAQADILVAEANRILAILTQS